MRGKSSPLDVDAHAQGRSLLVAGTALALAEGTAGVEPAGEAEGATAAKPEVLVPSANDKAVRGHEMAPREMPIERKPKILSLKGKYIPEAPAKGQT